MRKQLALLAIVLLAGRGVAAPQTATAHVTYVSGTSVYVDAGADDGLAVGDGVEVTRDGNAVAHLKVTFVTAHKATCAPDGAAADVKVGDAVRYIPRAPGADAGAAGAAAAGAAAGAAEAPASPARPAKSGESAFRRAGMRGRIGVRYLWVKDRSGLGQDLSQPSLDLLMLGTQIGGAPVDLDVDVRARRTYRTPAGGASVDDGVNRIYRANVSWRPGSFRLGFGRQVSPTLAVVSLFDGLVAEYRHSGWTAGLMAGTQPDPESYSFSSDVRQYGAYGGYSSDPARATRWATGFGYISSTENGEINRDFAFVEARVTQKIVGVYLQQQVDVNRGWRKDAEGNGYTPSGTFVMIHVRPAASWTIDTGYDSRRNVRLYRDLITPVTDFDDATRQGYWLGAAWRPRGRWLVGVDGRRATGGTAGTASAYTLRLGALNMTREQIDVQLRGTSYTGPTLEGYLAALSGSMNLGSRVRLELHGGTRQDKDVLGGNAATNINWFGTTLDVTAGRSVYFNLSYDRTSGGDEDNDQVYAAFSWRF